MATSKLIKPTNVTVSIPAFTDQPDQRVNSNCIDKSIDGINALSDQTGNILKIGTKTISTPMLYGHFNSSGNGALLNTGILVSGEVTSVSASRSGYAVLAGTGDISSKISSFTASINSGYVYISISTSQTYTATGIAIIELQSMTLTCS